MENENKIDTGINTDELNPEELKVLVENNKELLEENEVFSNVEHEESKRENKNEEAETDKNNFDHHREDNIITDFKNKNMNEASTFKTEINISSIQPQNKILINELEEKE